MTIPLQFASLYDDQEVFVWSDCLLDLGTDFLVGNMGFLCIEDVIIALRTICNKIWQTGEWPTPWT